MYDAKYALEIMKQELKNKYISPEIKYAFKASIEALEKQSKDEKVSELYKADELKFTRIWKEINNVVYFGDMKRRNFYNLIHEIAQIIKPSYDEIGSKFID